MNGSRAGSLPELHPGRLSGAPASQKTSTFSRPSARTKIASDWSIYSRDFTRVQLVLRLETCYLKVKPFRGTFGIF